MSDRDNFLYVRHPYQGEVKPENLVFNANLQEFSQRIGYICALETNGKLSSEEAYQQIKALWDQLEQSKHQLGAGDSPA